MSTLSVRLRECAKLEGTSINQLIASAVAEKMSALLTDDYLKERASRGSRKKFLAALAKVPDVEAETPDRIATPVRRARGRSSHG